jgi:clan AA aspartic protease (TIGR02281 family)
MSSPSPSINNKARFAAVAVFLLCALAALPALAGIYKWTDEQGNAHFTDSPDKIPPQFRSKNRGLEQVKERKNTSTPESAEHEIPGLPYVPEPNREHEVALAPGKIGGHFVKVRLNDKVDALLMVDTGASFVTLSEKIGAQLGIESSPDAPEIPLKTAGGLVWSPFVVLDSVQVGSAAVRRVDASINDKLDGLDGLLGMSFLGEFNMAFNEQKNTIVLKPLVQANDPAWGGRSGEWWKNKFALYSGVILQMERMADDFRKSGHEKIRNLEGVLDYYRKQHQTLKDYAGTYHLPDEYRVKARAVE